MASRRELPENQDELQNDSYRTGAPWLVLLTTMMMLNDDLIFPFKSANYPETQVAFQELQNELQEFFDSHIPKVASLQAIVHNLAHGSTHDNRCEAFASSPTFVASLLTSANSREPDDGSVPFQPKCRHGTISGHPPR